MSSLVIVESPAKCSKIQGFLGHGWRVIATMGHIRALEEDLDAVGLDRDFEPRYAFLKDKGKAIAGIRAAAKEASTVYLASDDDREGEAISYSVAVLLGLPVADTPRIVFHEITKPAILAAVATPRRIDMNRVHAQQARAILDMMVGFTISPLLWKFVGSGLSAGRCQTPALRIVAEREREIQDFSAETSWAVKGTWAAAGSKATFEAALTDALEDEESASNYLENIHAEVDGVVKEAATRATTESPPKPLITSTLQQEASALFGAQPKNTMKIAQRLYEAGHITYMRTDHAVLSAEAKEEAEGYVRTTFGESYIGTAAVTAAAAAPTTKSKKGKATPAQPQAQEAHEAIRPTHLSLPELPTDEDWSAVDRKVYKLIWNRTVQSVMAPARGEERTVLFTATGDPAEFLWSATWRRATFLGWKKVGQAAVELDTDDEATTTGKAPDGAWALGESLKPGTALQWQSLEAFPKTTKAAARYTEATLVRELEKRGIGRPSTFASLVGTILDKEYVEKRDVAAKEVAVKRLAVERPGQWPPTVVETKQKVGAEKQKLAPTPLGLSALEFCLREFEPLFAYTFTKQMEDRLDAIAEGKEPWKGLCRDTWASYRDTYQSLKAKKGTETASARQRTFEDGIKAVQSKKGPLLLIEGAAKEDTVFYGWPAGVAFADLTPAAAAAHVAAVKAERAGATLGEFEGAPMVKHTGPFGTYVTCGGVNVPFVAGDTAEMIAEKLRAKQTATLHTIGPFEFRKGPYGVYMFKKDVTGKARKFVGLPAAVDPKSLTQEAAVAIYQNGLKAKAQGKVYGATGGSGGAKAATGGWKKK